MIFDDHADHVQKRITRERLQLARTLLAAPLGSDVGSERSSLEL